MKKRFIVCIDQVTTADQSRISNFLKEHQSLGFSHYFSDVWLVTDPRKQWTAITLRDQLVSIVTSSNNIMVIETTGASSLAAIGPDLMVNWINKTWARN